MITPHQAFGTLVRRNIDQVNYQLRNRDTDLTLPKPKRELLKRILNYRGVMFWNQFSNEAKLAETI